MARRSFGIKSLTIVSYIAVPAVVANLVKWGIPAINGMAVAAMCYFLGRKLY